MNAPPDQELLQAIAADLGVDPSFVEKDWQAMRLVAVVGKVQYSDLRPVFSGGTSLSKAYGLIRRFSEDLDFKLILPEAGISRAACRQYRGRVLDAIRGDDDWTIEDTDILARNQSRFFSCLIGYPATLAVAPALRPQIRLEMTFSPPALPTEERSLLSFVAEARGDGPEVPAIACVAPAETAADKLSALAWRVLTRQRGSQDDDPTVIRHLHDLAALETHAVEHPGFPEQLYQTMLQDAARGGVTSEMAAMTPEMRLTAALEALTADPGYPGEYERFVLAMSYASESEIPPFEDALEAARRLKARLPSPC